MRIAIAELKQDGRAEGGGYGKPDGDAVLGVEYADDAGGQGQVGPDRKVELAGGERDDERDRQHLGGRG